MKVIDLLNKIANDTLPTTYAGKDILGMFNLK